MVAQIQGHRARSPPPTWRRTGKEHEPPAKAETRLVAFCYFQGEQLLSQALKQQSNNSQVKAKKTADCR
jgi:hypothetical protein